ncbi:uncharacterized protein LOC106077088 [Biomphalaria glabrata]|uniref:Uncharacterized protein LOC106077088 n=1 Tax=Biomphalaria glabrata TaxID=6526 RepID=A0A9W2YNK6_BIOGL|nr:uncharacterized protein LOC106077088 [Biomphalaria glabrata]
MRNRGEIPTGSSQVVAEVNESILNMKPHKRPGILGISAAYDLKFYSTINNLFSSSLTMEGLIQVGLTELRLDELNLWAGNDINHMILACKWNAAETCGPENFTRIITDHGLCYSFNGPASPRSLSLDTPGTSHGLHLTINIEEYERMLGPHVASGIHLLVHNRREYPLVRQLGQSVAAGSHASVALKLKKESRLGYPYDDCKDGAMVHVPNQTYSYSMPACKIECYVEFVLKRCGCRDYFMPGKTPVCTFRQYMLCLRSAQKEYDALEDKFCDCSTPCTSDKVEVSYSYGALSKQAISKVPPSEMDKIISRYRRALDVYEYISPDTVYKKDRYRNLTELLSGMKEIYVTKIPKLLSEFEKTLSDVNDKANQIYKTRLDVLETRKEIVKEYFVEQKDSWSKVTLGGAISDVYLFSLQILYIVQLIGGTTDNATRTHLYNTVINELKARSQLLNISLAAFEGKETASNSDESLSNDTLLSFVLHQSENVTSYKLANTSMNEVVQGRQLVKADIEKFRDLFSEMMDYLTLAYNTGRTSVDMIKTTIKKLAPLCQHYIIASDFLHGGTSENQLVELETQRAEVQNAKLKCDELFDSINETLAGVMELFTSPTSGALNFYYNVSRSIANYLTSVNITSKFVLADLTLGIEGEAAREELDFTDRKLADHISDLDSALNGLSFCWIENIQGVIEQEGIDTVFGWSNGKLGISFNNFTKLVRVNIAQLHNFTANLKEIKTAHDRLLKLVDFLTADLTDLRNQVKVDLNFQSKNFIILDIFFPDISYTVTEQQVAYDTVKLLSDIGGSMGLLVGSSAITLFEFVDFFCLLAFALCWKRRRSRSRDKSYGEKREL